MNFRPPKIRIATFFLGVQCVISQALKSQNVPDLYSRVFIPLSNRRQSLTAFFCKDGTTASCKGLASSLSFTGIPAFTSLWVGAFSLSVVNEGLSQQAVPRQSIFLVHLCYGWYFSFLLVTMLLSDLKHSGVVVNCCFRRATGSLAIHLPAPLASYGC